MGIYICKNIQWNLLNSKSSGLVVSFRTISILNYREVDIEIYKPLSFFSIKHKFWARTEMFKGDVSFMHPKHMLL